MGEEWGGAHHEGVAEVVLAVLVGADLVPRELVAPAAAALANGARVEAAHAGKGEEEGSSCPLTTRPTLRLLRREVLAL